MGQHTPNSNLCHKDSKVWDNILQTPISVTKMVKTDDPEVTWLSAHSNRVQKTWPGHRLPGGLPVSPTPKGFTCPIVVNISGSRFSKCKVLSMYGFISTSKWS